MRAHTFPWSTKYGRPWYLITSSIPASASWIRSRTRAASAPCHGVSVARYSSTPGSRTPIAALPLQPLVPDAMRLVRRRAELLVAEGLVVAEIALEEPDLAVALEREDVGRDAVEEPPVVADDDDAARERLEPGLEGAQRVDVEVVRRLVEEQHVAVGLQEFREMDAVPLPARERPDRLLLVRAAEVEAGHVRPCRDLARARLDDLDAVRDLLEYRPGPVELVASLVDVRELDGLADVDRACVWLLLADEHPEQRRLARAVGADDADDPRAWQAEREVLDQEPLTEPLAQVLDLDHLVPEPWPGRDGDLELAGDRLLVAGLREELLVRGQPRLALRLPR